MLLASLLPRRRNTLKAGKTQTFHGMESGVMATKTTIWRRLGSLMMVIHVHAHDIVVSRMVHWRGSRILEMIQFNHKLRVMTPNVVKQLNFVNVVVGPCCFLRINHFQFALERVKQILSYYILFHLSAWFHDLYIYIYHITSVMRTVFLWQMAYVPYVSYYCCFMIIREYNIIWLRIFALKYVKHTIIISNRVK